MHTQQRIKCTYSYEFSLEQKLVSKLIKLGLR